MTEEIRLDDIVMMKKKHPCGSFEWTVVRIGADIKLRCNGCNRVVMLSRDEFFKKRKRLISQGPVSAEDTVIEGLKEFYGKQGTDSGFNC